MFQRIRKFLKREEEGASMVEYALLLALIALVTIGSVTKVGSNLNSIFSNVAANLVKKS